MVRRLDLPVRRRPDCHVGLRDTSIGAHSRVQRHGVVFAFILALFHNHQGVGVIFHTGGQSLTVSTFLVAMFMSLYVIYGFDTASTLAEETRDPRREAPKAVLPSVVGDFL